MFKKSLSLIMSGVMLFCCLCINTSAAGMSDYSMTDAQWDEYWEENKDNFSGGYHCQPDLLYHCRCPALHAKYHLCGCGARYFVPVRPCV